MHQRPQRCRHGPSFPGRLPHLPRAYSSLPLRWRARGRACWMQQTRHGYPTTPMRALSPHLSCSLWRRRCSVARGRTNRRRERGRVSLGGTMPRGHTVSRCWTVRARTLVHARRHALRKGLQVPSCAERLRQNRCSRCARLRVRFEGRKVRPEHGTSAPACEETYAHPKG